MTLQVANFQRCQLVLACPIVQVSAHVCMIPKRLKKCFLYFFCVCFFMYNLCEKYYKPIIMQYCTVGCGSWVPRLALLNLQINVFARTLSEWNLFRCRGPPVPVGITCGSWTLPVPTVGSYRPASFPPLAVLAVLQGVLGIARPSAP